MWSKWPIRFRFHSLTWIICQLSLQDPESLRMMQFLLISLEILFNRRTFDHALYFIIDLTCLSSLRKKLLWNMFYKVSKAHPVLLCFRFLCSPVLSLSKLSQLNARFSALVTHAKTSWLWRLLTMILIKTELYVSSAHKFRQWCSSCKVRLPTFLHFLAFQKYHFGLWKLRETHIHRQKQCGRESAGKKNMKSEIDYAKRDCVHILKW